MDVQKAYDVWAAQYDTNNNKTRDLEAIALRENLTLLNCSSCLEIGCGTGKNTEWLLTKAEDIVAVDLSAEMLTKATEKISSEKVVFLQADINKPWSFVTKTFDLVTFSLVLEHIRNLNHVFQEAANALADGGHVYVGELHPFKQYTGTKARFETNEGLNVVACFNHNVSEFTQTAKKHGFEIENLNEYFDEDNRNLIPRILTIVFKKA
jgi:ubiquinone/menaquinone biosynthesis C-methylase UbiE